MDYLERADAAFRLSRIKSKAPKFLYEVSDNTGPWCIEQCEEAYQWRLRSNLSAIELARSRTDRHIIACKRPGSIRVVLIGESTAGSFGFWGSFSLASCIEAHLRKIVGRSDLEVIDLSRVNATWEECNDILHHAATLEPDLVLFLVGNNESKGILRYLEIGDAPVSRGAFKARWSIYQGRSERRTAEGLLRALTEHCLVRLRDTLRIAEALGMPLIYVLPAINSLHWLPQERCKLRLSRTEVMQWRDDLLANWSDGTLIPCPGSTAALWTTAVEQMDSSETLERLIERGWGLFVHPVPGLPWSVGNDLLSECRRQRVPFVDSRALLNESRSDIDRDFIDYCHLSEKGIRVVAPAIAREAAEILRKWVGSKSVLEDVLEPSAEERFQGSVVAMIHNYHYGQPRSNTEFWSLRALDSGWSGAIDYFKALRLVVLTRPRDSITPDRLRQLGLVCNDWDNRFNLYMTKFIYHERFDIELSRILQKSIQKCGAPTDAFSPQDPLLDSNGSLYSLYYLDMLCGFRPISRGATRNGWERPDLGIIIDRPVARIEFPRTSRRITGISFSIDYLAEASVSVELNGVSLPPPHCERGKHCVSIPQGDAEEGAMTNVLRFTFASMANPLDTDDDHERYFGTLRFGVYPAVGVLNDVALRFNTAEGDAEGC